MKNIIFRPLSQTDVPQMHTWFNLPHVQKFYSLRQWTEAEVMKKLEPYIEGRQPVNGFIALIDGKPIGYVQKYNIVDFPWPNQNRADEIVKNAAGIDLFIGDIDMIGKGIGSQLIQAFLNQHIWPNKQYCLIDPDISNTAAIRCYEKLNFTEHAVINSTDSLGKPVVLMLMIAKHKWIFD